MDEPDIPEFEPIEIAAGVASIELLSQLHGTLVADMIRTVTKGRATAAHWGQIRAILADNSINAQLGNNDKLEALKRKLEERRNAARKGIPSGVLAAAEAALERSTQE